MPLQDKIFRFSRRLLSSETAAKDATQEVLLKLWKAKKHLKKIKNIEAYAMTMTKNLCYDMLKSKHNSTLELVHSQYITTSSCLNSEIEARDEVTIVEQLIEQLPEQQRAIIQLRDVEQFSNKEIEEIMGLNSTSVRVALSRARKKIMTELKKTEAYGVQ
jgi:RNA polymerase sigma-70 factor (ECF subfamily)